MGSTSATPSETTRRSALRIRTVPDAGVHPTRPARQQKTPERRQRRFEPIDDLLEVRDVLRRQRRLLDSCRDLPARIGQQRAQRKQIPLDRSNHLIEIGIEPAGPRQSQPGVQLIDLAAGLDAAVRLRDPCAG